LAAPDDPCGSVRERHGVLAFRPSAGCQSRKPELPPARGTLLSFEAYQRTAGLEKQETWQ
jgi:hypothetical protein